MEGTMLAILFMVAAPTIAYFLGTKMGALQYDGVFPVGEAKVLCGVAGLVGALTVTLLVNITFYAPAIMATLVVGVGAMYLAVRKGFEKGEQDA